MGGAPAGATILAVAVTSAVGRAGAEMPRRQAHHDEKSAAEFGITGIGYVEILRICQARARKSENETESETA
jgi:hypothetical protein